MHQLLKRIGFVLHTNLVDSFLGACHLSPSYPLAAPEVIKMKNTTTHFLVLYVLSCMSGCASNGETWMTTTPKVYEGDSELVKVTRGAYHSTFDTAEVANEHCSQYSKLAELIEEASIWEIPNTDKYACVDL